MARDDRIFFDLARYGMASGLPDIDDIVGLNEILCIGGGLIFFPFRDGVTETYGKNPSVFQANNNSVYIDDYMPEVPTFTCKSWIPEKFDLLSYMKCYVVFRTVYRRSGFDDFFDIFLNILKEALMEINKYNEGDIRKKGGFSLGGVLHPVKTPGKGSSKRFSADIKSPSEMLLFLVELFQKGFSLEQFSRGEETAKRTGIMFTDYPALKTKFYSEIVEIFSSYGTQGISYALNNGRDVLAAWAGNFKSGNILSVKGVSQAVTKSVKDTASAAFNIDGRLLQMFYELMIVTWKYVQTPMPIHIPKKGWVYGYDREMKFSTSAKAGNIILADISIVKRQIAKSTYVEVKKDGEKSENVAPPSQEKPAQSGTCRIKENSSKYIKDCKAVNSNSNVTAKEIENLCNAYAGNSDGTLDKERQYQFNTVLSRGGIAYDVIEPRNAFYKAIKASGIASPPTADKVVLPAYIDVEGANFVDSSNASIKSYTKK